MRHPDGQRGENPRGQISSEPSQKAQSRHAYSVAEAANQCGLSERRLRDFIRTGQLKVSRAGRRVLVRPERLDEFLQSLEVEQ